MLVFPNASSTQLNLTSLDWPSNCREEVAQNAKFSVAKLSDFFSHDKTNYDDLFKSINGNLRIFPVLQFNPGATDQIDKRWPGCNLRQNLRKNFTTFQLVSEMT